MLDILHDARSESAFGSQAHIRSEGSMRLPPGRGPWRSLLQHTINLLERQALRLRDQEVRIDKGAGAETTPNEEDFGSQVPFVGADHVGSDDSDDAVPEPVGCGGESYTTGADGQGEDLADDDPCARAPGGGEEEDEDADECDFRLDGVGVAAICGADDGDEELADDHAQGAPQE